MVVLNQFLLRDYSSLHHFIHRRRSSVKRLQFQTLCFTGDPSFRFLGDWEAFRLVIPQGITKNQEINVDPKELAQIYHKIWFRTHDFGNKPAVSRQMCEWGMVKTYQIHQNLRLLEMCHLVAFYSSDHHGQATEHLLCYVNLTRSCPLELGKASFRGPSSACSNEQQGRGAHMIANHGSKEDKQYDTCKNMYQPTNWVRFR